MKFKILFAGTPEFAVPTLTALINSRHEILAVLTKPDRPAGRGQKLTESPVKILAKNYHLPILQPEHLNTSDMIATLQNFQADLMVVVGYGLLLSKTVLNIPYLGCINVHPSLLPRWRGAAPIQYSILAGDTQSGVTIMRMNEGLDTGDILHQKNCPIYPRDTAKSLYDRLAQLGAEELILTLELLRNKKINPQPQNDEQATYAHKISKHEGNIDWQDSAINLDRKIRAFNLWPIAYTHLENKTIRIWQAEINDSTSHESPGTIIKSTPEGIEVATGQGILRLLTLQLPGSKPLSIKEILKARFDMFYLGNRFD